MPKQADFIGFKVSEQLKSDIESTCGGHNCSVSKYVKDAVLKQLSLDKKLSMESAKLTLGRAAFKTLNYCQLTEEDETSGIITIYDDTCSFITHILVPFTKDGKTLYRDQNGYVWENDDNEGPIPIFTENGECKEPENLRGFGFVSLYIGEGSKPTATA